MLDCEDVGQHLLGERTTPPLALADKARMAHANAERMLRLNPIAQVVRPGAVAPRSVIADFTVSGAHSPEPAKRHLNGLLATVACLLAADSSKIHRLV